MVLRTTGLASLASALLLATAAGACVRASAADLQQEADQFLELVNTAYQSLYRIESEAQWFAATDVSAAHDAASETAGKARAAFCGNPAVITQAKAFLAHRDQLAPLTVRQLEQALQNAAEGPMTNPKLVSDRIEAETAQSSTLNSFTFKRGGKPITVNEIDKVLQTSRDLNERREVWEASKESGVALKPGLIRLRDFRNGVARELGHADYFALQVANYRMKGEEMVRLQDDFTAQLRPLYLQLHTWAKHALAKRYNQPVPKLIPAHWLDNRWSQEWPGIVESAKLDEHFKGRSAEWVVRTAEDFYTGLGFPKLPTTFWERSDLYPVPAGQARKKNTHASCWHVDLQTDVRSLMSVEPDPWWFFTAHHELGHGYYFISYTKPEVPPLLRIGANPAFHEGMGELISLAASQVPYLQAIHLLPEDLKADDAAFLLNDALSHSVPFIFWSSGTMTHWEADVYSRGLAPDQWNARWWKYVREFQGVEAPSARGEEFCDAATKTHINDNPCYYYSYAIATVLKFQLHDYIAKNILKQPPQRCNYANNKEVGAFLRHLMEKGGTEDWRKLLRETTGEDLSTRAMVDYFRPLMAWLEKENAGRQIGWD